MTIEEATAAAGKRVIIDGPLNVHHGELIYTSDTHAFVLIDGEDRYSPVHPDLLKLEQ